MAVICSVVLHIALFALINQKSLPKPARVKKQAKIIQAILVNIPPAQKGIEEQSELPKSSSKTDQLVSNEQQPADQKVSSTKSTGDYLQAMQRSKDLRLAEQSSQLYQQQKTSPTIATKPVNPFTSEDEKFILKTKSHIDCSTGLNKTLAILAGIGGGNVGCTQLPEIDSFIQKRLDEHTKTKNTSSTK